MINNNLIIIDSISWSCEPKKTLLSKSVNVFVVSSVPNHMANVYQNVTTRKVLFQKGAEDSKYDLISIPQKVKVLSTSLSSVRQ